MRLRLLLATAALASISASALAQTDASAPNDVRNQPTAQADAQAGHQTGVTDEASSSGVKTSSGAKAKSHGKTHHGGGKSTATGRSKTSGGADSGASPSGPG